MYLKAGREGFLGEGRGGEGGKKRERGRKLSTISGILFFHSWHPFIEQNSTLELEN